MNTKNDEHENIVASLREQQEERIQQILAETKAKVDTYKDKVAKFADEAQKIQSLQESFREVDAQRQKALTDFEEYKHQAEEREFNLKTQYSQKMINMAHDVMVQKQEFEMKLASVENLREQMESDKRRSLEEMAERHRKELEMAVAQSRLSDEQSMSELRARLEAEQKTEVEQLNHQIERLNAEKARMIEDYEAKLNKAQAFYEKELEVLKNTQNSSHEEKLLALREQYDKFRKDADFKESQDKKRIENLINQLSVSEEDLGKLKNELSSLKSSLGNKETDISLLHKQVSLYVL